MYNHKLIHFLAKYIYSEDYYIFNNIKPKSIKYYSDIIQTGGTKKINLEYNGEKHVFRMIDNELYVLYSSEKEDCITINIDIENKTANVNNISADTIGLCFKRVTTKKGTELLKLAIKFAKKLAQEKIYDINKIILTDNSHLYCNELKTSIKFSDLRMIISGDTFYGKHGFVPSNNNDIITYNKNKKVLSKLLIKDIKFDKYLKQFIQDGVNSVNNIRKFIDENMNMKISEFFDNLSNNENFQTNCMLVDFLIKKIYRHYNLESLYSMKYEMHI